MFAPKVTAPHLDSTQLARSAPAGRNPAQINTIGRRIIWTCLQQIACLLGSPIAPMERKRLRVNAIRIVSEEENASFCVPVTPAGL